MLTPIETLLMLDGGGQPGVIVTPLVSGAGSYSPNSSVDFTPAQPQRLTVNGIFSDGWREGMELGEIATMLIPSTGLPDGTVPVKSSFEMDGVTYQIVRIRRRVFMGRTDGFDLFLAA